MIVISNISALEVWEALGSDDAKRTRSRIRKPTGNAHPTTDSELGFLHALGLRTPVHLAIDRPGKRSASDGFIAHVHSRPVPDRTLCDMGDGVLVEAPELAYMRMSRGLSYVERQMLAMELCGCYSTLGTGDSGGFKQREPLLTIHKLQTFLSKEHSASYAATAVSPLRYLADGSASPMETIVELLLCEPYRRGGYGFPIPEMNSRIDVPPDVEVWGGKPFYKCDLFWRGARLAIEYDSNEFHSSSASLNRDAIRRNAIEHLGIRVVTLTFNQVRNQFVFHGVVPQIAKALGKRRQLPEGFLASNTALRKALFTPMPWQS